MWRALSDDRRPHDGAVREAMSTANSLPQAPHPSLESEQRAHEPSMEEILASIRRIIADDDALPLMRRPAPSLVVREPASSQPQPAAPTPSVHLVAVPAADSDVHRPQETPPAEEPASAAGEQEDFAANDHEYEFRAALRDTLAEEREPDPASIAPEPHSPMRVEVREPQERDRTPLVSPSTDASVASSFQSLAASMFLRDSDMIARTAREMLRPMLKQWLDDNLPVMVERLVRAEIERVARGGR
jgi:cell pole-organizing protein PopZ